MRTLLTMFSFFVVGMSNGQLFLTNGEIYDYQVGDVFQAEGQSTNGWGQSQPPGIYTDTVLVREEVDGGAGIRYVMKRWTVFYQYFPNPPLVTTHIDTLVVTGLDQSPTVPFEFCGPVDSIAVYYPQCGLLRWWRYGTEDTCWTEGSASCWYYQGCGGPFFSSYSEDAGSMSYELIYYHKAGVECGTFWDLPMAVSPEAAESTVRIQPNPATNSISVSGIGPRGGVIRNAAGQRVGLVTKGSEMSVTSLPSGTYWVVGDDARGNGFRMPFVKQ
ncbi:MAG: T9SS type A sorting domain-containing protein [Flavobacteriales bacterium]|nr:T9SS type A sorting domain-containing protein [Flavobacteriales bacterium]